MAEKLKKDLGLLDIFCIASGAMISSGLFILPGIASAKTGPALFISYIIASILALPALLSKAELATAMPKAGGDYFFITRSMGPSIGTIGGAASWFSLSLKSAFALIGMSAYTAIIIRNIPVKIIAVFLCVFFVALNIKGVREAGIFQRVLVFGLFGTLLFYVFYGFPSIDINRFVPFAPFGKKAVFATAGLVFISYGGLTKIASLAEEVKDPGRNIPLGMILSLITVGIFYAMVVFITTGLLDAGKLSSSLTPISDGAHVFMGVFGNAVMACAALLAFISTANAGIMAASRYPIAMSRDKIVPAFFKKIDNNSATPRNSIIFTGIFMIVAILFLNIELLVKVASTFLILLYALVNLAVIIMRESRIQNYRPRFRAPLYPWMQVAGIISSGFLIFEMGKTTYLITGLFVIAGFVWYVAYVRPRVKREFALIHVIERITAKELTSNYLESELKEILMERDEIVEDRFDRLINGCVILDIDRPMNSSEFFREAASSMAGRLDTESEVIFNLLTKREAETSTVIRPGLAIPHIIIEGGKKFEILPARCKEGIVFPGSNIPVRIVFMLAGSADERNFHLRALAAIAEIAQSGDFDKRWMAARNSEDLRHIILLAERKRFLGK
ncbi:MAG: amino acid permease [Candidatus Omnitrophica bacterium]|nr:amino acid permease [Candidatus Omnitrophota bacterium]